MITSSAPSPAHRFSGLPDDMGLAGLTPRGRVARGVDLLAMVSLAQFTLVSAYAAFRAVQDVISLCGPQYYTGRATPNLECGRRPVARVRRLSRLG